MSARQIANCFTKIVTKSVINNKQINFVFQSHFSVVVATQVSHCYSHNAFSQALIHDVTFGLLGLAYILRDSSEIGFALGLC
jgi:hypothetical protein